LKTVLPELSDDMSSRVTAAVRTLLVTLATQLRMLRSRKNNPTVKAQLAQHAVQNVSVLVDVRENIECAYNVELV
jgi:hypothetical protein